MAVDEPFATITVTTPGPRDGAVHVRRGRPDTDTAVAAMPPNVTVVPVPKFVPAIVTLEDE